MATALARGCLTSGLISGERLLAADPSGDALRAFTDSVPGAQVFDTIRPVLEGADIVVLAVKPQVMASVLEELKSYVTDRHVLVSIAAGITLATIAAVLPASTRLIRVMPNTPCLVGMGASCFSRGARATADDAHRVDRILRSVGESFEVTEAVLDAVTGLSGSGPAFIYHVIESMADGGVAMGLPADLALRLAAQTAKGAAEMVLTTGRTPAELREQVTSPGGTTLAGLTELERLAGAQAFRAAVVAATKRSEELGRS